MSGLQPHDLEWLRELKPGDILTKYVTYPALRRLLAAFDAQAARLAAVEHGLIDALDRAYAAFERRVLIEHSHRDCPFGQHARTCYEEAFRAGWMAAVAARRAGKGQGHGQFTPQP